MTAVLSILCRLPAAVILLLMVESFESVVIDGLSCFSRGHRICESFILNLFLSLIICALAVKNVCSINAQYSS